GQDIHPALWCTKEAMRKRCRNAFFIQHGHQCLANAKVGNEIFGFIEIAEWIVLGSLLDRLPVRSREGAKRMLYFQTELGKDGRRNIHWVLCAEEHTDSFRANEFDDCLDLLHMCIACFLEDQVRLVDEEYKLRLVEVAFFR